MPTPTPPSITIAVLRILRGWSQRELAQAAGVRPSTLSDYERGKKTPSRRMLDRLNAVMGFPPSQVDRTLAFIDAARSALAGRAAVPDLAAIADEEGRRYAEFILASTGRVLSKAAALEERRRAPALWARLRRYPAGDRRAMVRENEEFRSWALSELLCEESVKAAADKPDDALALAELALLIGELLPAEDEGLRSCTQGYAWAFVGNARRVKGDLPGADAAFARCKELCSAGTSAAQCLFDEARLLDLEASLRREQRHLPQAIDLLDQAFAVANSDEAKGRILVNRGKALEELGDYEAAVATLRRAAPLIDRAVNPRLYLCLRFNLLENLFQTGGLGEAASMLPEVQELTARQGNDLDVVRFRWLEGRLAAGLGRRGEAERAFRQVRAELARRDIAYDVALVSMELAVLLAEQGRTGDVKNLARQMTPLFQAQGVHREALAALGLFCKAAEAEAATAELAREVLEFLRRARHNAELRFTPAG